MACRQCVQCLEACRLDVFSSIRAKTLLIMQRAKGWDVLEACNAVRKAAQARNDSVALKAAAAVRKRATKVWQASTASSVQPVSTQCDCTCCVAMLLLQATLGNACP